MEMSISHTGVGKQGLLQAAALSNGRSPIIVSCRTDQHSGTCLQAQAYFHLNVNAGPATDAVCMNSEEDTSKSPGQSEASASVRHAHAVAVGAHKFASLLQNIQQQYSMVGLPTFCCISNNVSCSTGHWPMMLHVQCVSEEIWTGVCRFVQNLSSCNHFPLQNVKPILSLTISDHSLSSMPSSRHQLWAT